MRMRQPKLALHALLACAAWSAGGLLFAQDDTVYWFMNYREGMQEAKRTQKPVFLEFRCEA